MQTQYSRLEKLGLKVSTTVTMFSDSDTTLVTALLLSRSKSDCVTENAAKGKTLKETVPTQGWLAHGW